MRFFYRGHNSPHLRRGDGALQEEDQTRQHSSPYCAEGLQAQPGTYGQVANFSRNTSVGAANAEQHCKLRAIGACQGQILKRPLLMGRASFTTAI